MNITGLAIAIAILVAAAVAALWSPLLGGIIAMLPTKVIGYTVILLGKGDADGLRKGVEGMLIGTTCITVPSLVALWWWVK